MPLLEIDRLSVRYGVVAAVDEVSFAVEDDSIVSLVGSNGAGKSSLLRCLMGLVTRSGGSIRFQGEDLPCMSADRVVRRGIALSPEGRRVFIDCTVLENLESGAYTLSKSVVADRLEQVLTYFPRLAERRKQAAGTMSGGEQQMLAIGRALMSRPKLLLLDEPSLGLAPMMVARIGELIAKIREQEKIAVILAEQNARWALGMASQGIVFERGSMVLSGKSSDLLRDERVKKAYLGIG